MGVVILLLGRMSEDGLTASWWRFASSFVRVNVEGGMAALAASLLPYPRFATRDGALRAQVGVRLLVGFAKRGEQAHVRDVRRLCVRSFGERVRLGAFYLLLYPPCFPSLSWSVCKCVCGGVRVCVYVTHGRRPLPLAIPYPRFCLPLETCTGRSPLVPGVVRVRLRLVSGFAWGNVGVLGFEGVEPNLNTAPYAQVRHEFAWVQ